MPPSLAEFQESFGRHLAAGVPLGMGRNSVSRAIAIHRNTAMRAAQDALEANYPVVRALFGGTAFQGCTVTYVATEPPKEARLNAYGAGFARFLETYTPAMTTPYISEVARLERLYNEALFAADADALRASEAVTRIASGQALVLHPATRHAVFQSPAVSIWRAHRDVTAMEDIVWRSEAVLITRPEVEVLVRDLPLGGPEFLDACAHDKPIAEAAQAARDAGADLTALFRLLIEVGAFQAKSNGKQS